MLEYVGIYAIIAMMLWGVALRFSHFRATEQGHKMTSEDEVGSFIAGWFWPLTIVVALCMMFYVGWIRMWKYKC